VVGVAAVAVIVAQFVLGGKGYYPGGIYTFCFAARATALSGRPLRRRAVVYCVAVAVNADPALLRRWFSSARVAAVYRNGLGVSDDEEGAVIYVATGLRSPWAAAWPSFRDYS
jgi:hypothetical protein